MRDSCSYPICLEGTLLLMACSGVKKVVANQAEMPLFELYDGPMWRTLRSKLRAANQLADESERRCRVVVLSGRYGIVEASMNSPIYEAKLTAHKADALIRAGLFAKQDWFGELNGKHGLAGSPYCALAARTTDVRSPEPLRRLPWSLVIVAAGGEYRRVYASMLDQLRENGDLAKDARTLWTRGGIGQQRAQLGAWIEQLQINTGSLIDFQ